ncbi:GtrA family protein [Burkholderiaceae bacterium UC74_6]
MPALPSDKRPLQGRRITRELAGYLACSVLALLLDTGVYAGALALGISLALSAALGFIAGVSCAYFCSVKFVFQARRLKDRSTEFAAFVAIGLAGLVLTEGLLWLLVQQLHLAPVTAKLITAGIVFFFNFGVRKALLFNPARRRPAAQQDSRLEPLL